MNEDIKNMVENVLEEEKKEKEHKEQKVKKENISKGIGSVKNVIDGTMLTSNKTVKQLPFIFFLGVLGLFYIGNRYNAEKIVRKTNKVQSELKELRSEQIAVASELMQISKQSVVLKLIENYELDLIESTEPPKIIKFEK